MCDVMSWLLCDVAPWLLCDAAPWLLCDATSSLLCDVASSLYGLCGGGVGLLHWWGSSTLLVKNILKNKLKKTYLWASLSSFVVMVVVVHHCGGVKVVQVDWCDVVVWHGRWHVVWGWVKVIILVVNAIIIKGINLFYYTYICIYNKIGFNWSYLTGPNWFLFYFQMRQPQLVAFGKCDEPQLKVQSFLVQSSLGPVFFQSIGPDIKTLHTLIAPSEGESSRCLLMQRLVKTIFGTLTLRKREIFQQWITWQHQKFPHDLISCNYIFQFLKHLGLGWNKVSLTGKKENKVTQYMTF